MTPLPIADRVALFVDRQRRTARELARVFEAEAALVRQALQQLEEKGVLERVSAPGPTVWRTAPGVTVEYAPGRIEIRGARDRSQDECPEGDAEPDPEETIDQEDDEDGRCRAQTNQGERCKHPATRDGLCGIHTP